LGLLPDAAASFWEAHRFFFFSPLRFWQKANATNKLLLTSHSLSFFLFFYFSILYFLFFYPFVFFEVSQERVASHPLLSFFVTCWGSSRYLFVSGELSLSLSLSFLV